MFKDWIKSLPTVSPPNALTMAINETLGENFQTAQQDVEVERQVEEIVNIESEAVEGIAEEVPEAVEVIVKAGDAISEVGQLIAGADDAIPEVDQPIAGADDAIAQVDDIIRELLENEDMRRALNQTERDEGNRNEFV